VVDVLRRHRRVLATLGSAVVVVGAVRGMRTSVLPLWSEQAGLDASQTSLVFGLAGLVDLLLFYPAGRVMDAHGRTWVAVPVVATVAVGLLLLPLATGFGTVLAVAVLMAVGNGMGAGVVMTLGADVAPAEGRSQSSAGGAWRGTSAPRADRSWSPPSRGRRRSPWRASSPAAWRCWGRGGWRARLSRAEVLRRDEPSAVLRRAVRLVEEVGDDGPQVLDVADEHVPTCLDVDQTSPREAVDEGLGLVVRGQTRGRALTTRTGQVTASTGSLSWIISGAATTRSNSVPALRGARGNMVSLISVSSRRSGPAGHASAIPAARPTRTGEWLSRHTTRSERSSSRTAATGGSTRVRREGSSGDSRSSDRTRRGAGQRT
jgi:hypothetical protein